MVLTLTEAVAVVALKYEIPFQDYRLLGSWLECYQYIYPANRTLVSGMANLLLNTGGVSRAQEIFRAWLSADLVESSLTPAEQRNVIAYLEGGM